MNEFESINTLIKSTPVVSAIISSCLFIIYQLIVKSFEYAKAKDSSKPISEISVAIKEISTNLNGLNIVLSKFIQDSTRNNDDRCKTVINLSFCKFEKELYTFARNTIINNNIQRNKELIIANINQKISTEYYNLLSSLALFEIDNKLLSSHLKESWKDEITNDIIQIIYSNAESDAINRINLVGNKLSLRIASYSTYIHNKTFND